MENNLPQQFRTAEYYTGLIEQFKSSGDAELKNMVKKQRIIFAPTIEQIIEKGKQIENAELRALYFFEYQTATRISEALKLKFGDVRVASEDSHRYALARVVTLKNRKKGIRFLPIPLYIGYEAQMYEYWKGIYEHRTDKVFKNVGSRNNVWDKFNDLIAFDTEVYSFSTKEITTQKVKLYPHLLRHFRLTHLVDIYKYDAFRLTEYAGWASSKPAAIYVSLNWKSLAAGFAASKVR